MPAGFLNIDMSYSFLRLAGLLFVIFFGFILNGIYIAKNKKNIFIFFGLVVAPASVYLIISFSFVFLLAVLIAYFVFLWRSPGIYRWVESRFEFIVADLPFFPRGALMGIYLVFFHWFMSMFLLWRLNAG